MKRIGRESSSTLLGQSCEFVRDGERALPIDLEIDGFVAVSLALNRVAISDSIRPEDDAVPLRALVARDSVVGCASSIIARERYRELDRRRNRRRPPPDPSSLARVMRTVEQGRAGLRR